VVAARSVEAGVARDPPAVLRIDAPAFDLEVMVARFDRLWRRNQETPLAKLSSRRATVAEDRRA